MKMRKKDSKYCITCVTWDEALLFEMMWFMYEKAKEAVTTRADHLKGLPIDVAEKLLGFPIPTSARIQDPKDESNPA